jgi:hypothetical protein
VRTAQLAIRSWSATASDPALRGLSFSSGRGEEALANSRGLPAPFFTQNSCGCGAANTVKFFLERLTVPSLVGLNLAGARPPRLTAKLSKPRCPPGGALLFGANRAADWRNQTYSSQISILVGLEARAVSESETEAERLRAHARRALELAKAINDPEAALRLKALAADLLERADALERKDEN